MCEILGYPTASKWLSNYRKLVAHFNEHGHSEVSKIDDKHLYRWCKAQRAFSHSHFMGEDEKRLLHAVRFRFT